MASVVPQWYSGPPSLYTDVTVEQALGPRGAREEFVNAQQLKLASYLFPASGTPKALAILVHGHGCSLQHEYLRSSEAGKPAVYACSLVERLNEAGISVAGIDLQGCGHSQGLRCYVERFQHYVQEVVDFTRALDDSKRPGFSGLPRFVIGDSLGGCIAANICSNSDLFRGAVLIAPMLSLEKISKSGLNPYLRPIAGLISRLLPKLQAVKTEKSPLNPEIQAFFDKDPQMWHGWTRARNASEYLLATEALCKAMPSVTFPFVCFHGEADTMTDADGSKKLYEEAQSEDKTLHMRPGRWHVLLKEPGCEEVWSLIVDWIATRCPAAAAPAIPINVLQP